MIKPEFAKQEMAKRAEFLLQRLFMQMISDTKIEES